jgi:hypothetical protein
MATKKAAPSWSDVKTRLTDFDRAGLLGLQDEGYFGALVRMFEQALKTISNLNEGQRQPLWDRLRAVHQICRNFGYGVSDDMGDLLSEYGADD